MLTNDPKIRMNEEIKNIWLFDFQRIQVILTYQNHLQIYRQKDKSYHLIHSIDMTKNSGELEHKIQNIQYNALTQILYWLIIEKKEKAIQFLNLTSSDFLLNTRLVDDNIQGFQLFENGQFMMLAIKRNGYFHVTIDNIENYNKTSDQKINFPTDNCLFVSAYFIRENSFFFTQRNHEQTQLFRTDNLSDFKSKLISLAKIDDNVGIFSLHPTEEIMAYAKLDSFDNQVKLFSLHTKRIEGVIKDCYGSPKKIIFHPLTNRLIVHVQLLSNRPIEEIVYCFTLHDLRQSYTFYTECSGLILADSVEPNKLIGTQENKILSWDIEQRSSLLSRLSYHLQKNNEERLTINGISLLKIAYQAVQELLAPIVEQAKTKTSRQLRDIRSGEDWLLTAGRLAKFIASSDKRNNDKLYPGKITVGEKSHQTKVTVREEFVQFPAGRGSYAEITDDLMKLTNAPKYEPSAKDYHMMMMMRLNNISVKEFSKKFKNPDHAELAKTLLKRIQLQPYPDSLTNENKIFLDTLLILLIGVESSRINMTFLTTILLLDLISHNQTYGRLYRAYSWKNAFISGPGYRWNDHEQRDYGGKFPMAVNSTGRGNFQLFSKMLKTPDDENLEKKALIEIINNYQHCQIQKKSISLIIHWLNDLDDQHLNFLKSSENSTELQIKLKELFKNRLRAAYQLMTPEPTPKVFLKTNHDSLSLTDPLPNNQRTIVGLQYYLVISDTTNQTDKEENYYHRTDIPCKLVNPSYLTQDEKEFFNISDKKYHRTHAQLKLVKRKLSGIKRIFSKNGFYNQIQEDGENTVIILDKEISTQSCQDNSRIRLSKKLGGKLIWIVTSLLKELELGYYHYEGDNKTGFNSLPQEELNILRKVRFQNIHETQNTITSEITLEHLCNYINDRPDEILTELELMKLSGKLFQEILTHFYPGSIALAMSHQKFPAKKTFVTFTMKNKTLSTTTTLNKTIFDELQKKAQAIDSELDKPELIQLAFNLFHRAFYQFDRIYSVISESGKPLNPCSKCYSSSAPEYPGLPYNYDNVPCVFFPDENNIYHRLYVDRHNRVCDSVTYDKNTSQFFLNNSKKSSAEIGFVKYAENKLNRQPCSSCFWHLPDNPVTSTELNSSTKTHKKRSSSQVFSEKNKKLKRSKSNGKSFLFPT